MPRDTIINSNNSPIVVAHKKKHPHHLSQSLERSRLDNMLKTRRKKKTLFLIGSMDHRGDTKGGLFAV